MSVRVLNPSRKAWSRVETWVGRLNAAGSFQTRGLSACKDSALWLAAPHPVFGLSPASFAAGLGMEGAALLSWRFVLGLGTQQTALVSVAANAPGSVLRDISLSEGALVVAHVNAFEELHTRFANSSNDYALGCISISWLAVKAVWLRNLVGAPREDIFLVLAGPDNALGSLNHLLDAARFMAYLKFAHEAMPCEVIRSSTE